MTPASDIPLTAASNPLTSDVFSVEPPFMDPPLKASFSVDASIVSAASGDTTLMDADSLDTVETALMVADSVDNVHFGDADVIPFMSASDGTPPVTAFSGNPPVMDGATGETPSMFASDGIPFMSASGDALLKTSVFGYSVITDTASVPDGIQPMNTSSVLMLSMAAVLETPVISFAFSDIPTKEAASFGTPHMDANCEIPLMSASGDKQLIFSASGGTQPIMSASGDKQLIFSASGGTQPLDTSAYAQPMDACSDTALFSVPGDILLDVNSIKQLLRRPKLLQRVTLPPLSDPRKKTVFLDLDNTLVFSRKGNPPPEKYDFTVKFVNPSTKTKKISKYFVVKRPGVDELLCTAAKYFEVVIFTAATKHYASSIIKKLDPERKMITNRLYRDSCWEVAGGMGYVKDLSMLGRELQNVIIVDDRPISYALQIKNGVRVLPFYGDPNDMELRRVVEFLGVARHFRDSRDAVRHYGTPTMEKVVSFMANLGHKKSKTLPESSPEPFPSTVSPYE